MKSFFIKPLAAALFTISLCSSGAGQEESTAAPAGVQKENVTIDGADKDWPSLLPFTAEKMGIQYVVTHNESTLYIFLKMKDPQTQMRVLRGGFTLFINQEGKKKETTSIHYPLELEEQHQPPVPNLSSLKFAVHLHAKEAEVRGFGRGSSRLALEEQKEGSLQVKLGFKESGELLYEVAVPFSVLYKKAPEGEKPPLAVGFSLKSVSPDRRMATDGGTPPPARGRNPGGGGTLSGVPVVTNGRQMQFSSGTAWEWKIVSLSSIARLQR